MPAQRDWTREAVLRRFLGVKSGRKARYAALLVEALDPGRAPLPLASVLEGGTWALGRELAAQRRSDGGPPIRVVSDGTVF